MQPSPAMQALIEQIYHIFRRYPVPQKFVVCCEYCLSQQEQPESAGTKGITEYIVTSDLVFLNQCME